MLLLEVPQVQRLPRSSEIYNFTGIGYDIEGNAIDDDGEIVDIDNGAKKVAKKLYLHYYGNKYAKYLQDGPNPFTSLK